MTAEICPCDKQLPYSQCCEPYHRGLAFPATAADLMRSRYSAFAKHEIDYIASTLAPRHKGDFNRKEIEDWSRNSEWQGLTVVATEKGGAQDSEGQVEFIARFRADNQNRAHEELASFIKLEGRWYFDDSRLPPVKQVKNEAPKIGRNDPCSCGSGKKYKKCHGVGA
jgi:SEC-C motif domain protein